MKTGHFFKNAQSIKYSTPKAIEYRIHPEAILV